MAVPVERRIRLLEGRRNEGGLERLDLVVNLRHDGYEAHRTHERSADAEPQAQYQDEVG